MMTVSNLVSSGDFYVSAGYVPKGSVEICTAQAGLVAAVKSVGTKVV